MTIEFKQLENRGELTKELSQYYFNKTNRVLTKSELKTIHFMMELFHKNENIINVFEINHLKSLNEEGLIRLERVNNKVRSYKLKIEYEFYKICNELLYHCYVLKIEEKEVIGKDIDLDLLAENIEILKKIKNSLMNKGVIKFLAYGVDRNLIDKNMLFLSKLQGTEGLFIHNCDHSEYYSYYSKFRSSKKFWNEMNQVLFEMQ